MSRAMCVWMLPLMVLAACVAEPTPQVERAHNETTPQLGVESSAAAVLSVPSAPMAQIATLDLTPAPIGQSAADVLAAGHARCETLGCVVEVMSFDYTTRHGQRTPDIDEVVDSVRVHLGHRIPLDNEGASSWKLFGGDMARLDMDDILSVAADQMKSDDLELGRATALHLPKSDQAVFSTAYVVHSPEHRIFFVVLVSETM